MQWLGTNVFRARVAEDVWVRRTIDVSLPRYPRACITDCRFRNEAQLLRDALHPHVTFVRVVDPALPPPGPDAHVSEREGATIEVDTTLINNKTQGLEALARAVRTLAAPFTIVPGGLSGGPDDGVTLMSAHTTS
jgi:hypothetical protein